MSSVWRTTLVGKSNWDISRALLIATTPTTAVATQLAWVPWRSHPLIETDKVTGRRLPNCPLPQHPKASDDGSLNQYVEDRRDDALNDLEERGGLDGDLADMFDRRRSRGSDDDEDGGRYDGGAGGGSVSPNLESPVISAPALDDPNPWQLKSKHAVRHAGEIVALLMCSDLGGSASSGASPPDLPKSLISKAASTFAGALTALHVRNGLRFCRCTFDGCLSRRAGFHGFMDAFFKTIGLTRDLISDRYTDDDTILVTRSAQLTEMFIAASRSAELSSSMREAIQKRDSQMRDRGVLNFPEIQGRPGLTGERNGRIDVVVLATLLYHCPFFIMDHMAREIRRQLLSAEDEPSDADRRRLALTFLDLMRNILEENRCSTAIVSPQTFEGSYLWGMDPEDAAAFIVESWKFWPPSAKSDGTSDNKDRREEKRQKRERRDLMESWAETIGSVGGFARFTSGTSVRFSEAILATCPSEKDRSLIRKHIPA